MDELAPPAAAVTDDRSTLDPRWARRATLPLLAGYLTFGQFWGAWVILVLEFQQHHGLSDSRLGVLYTMLSLTAVAVMLLLAPRLQRLPLSTVVPASLVVLAAGAGVIAFLPTQVVVLGSWSWVRATG